MPPKRKGAPSSSKPKANPDFKQKKQKLGKRKLKPENQTNIEFKAKGVYMSQQNLRSTDTLESTWVTNRNLSLQDILPKFKHFSTKTIISALKSLLELIQLHPMVLKLYLGKILNEILPLILCDDEKVHVHFLNVLKFALPKISSASLSPFISLIMAYVSSCLTHTFSLMRLFGLKTLNLFIKNFPNLLSQYSVKIIPNICYIFMLSRRGVAYKGKNYRSIQEYCVTILNEYLSILFENNKLGIPKANLHTHTHHHFNLNKNNVKNGGNSENEEENGGNEESDEEGIYFSRKSSLENINTKFDSVAEYKLKLISQIITRKLATNHSINNNSNSTITTMATTNNFTIDTSTAVATASSDNTNELDEERKFEMKQNLSSITTDLKKILEEETDIKIYNLENEESIVTFFEIIFKILVDVWIEILDDDVNMVVKSERTTIQSEYILNILKSILDIAYQLLYAFEHLNTLQNNKNGINSLQNGKNQWKVKMDMLLQKYLHFFLKHFPLQLSISLRGTQNLIYRTNASLLAFLSFSFFSKPSQHSLRNALQSSRDNNEEEEHELNEWEILFLKNYHSLLNNSTNNNSSGDNNLEDEDFSKLLGIFYRIYKYLPNNIKEHLWKSLTNLFINEAQSTTNNQSKNRNQFSSKQKQILEFLSNVGLKNEFIIPPPKIIEQWINILPPILSNLYIPNKDNNDDKDNNNNLNFSKYILNVLLTLAKDIKFQKYINKEPIDNKDNNNGTGINEKIIPFFYNEETKQFGPFIYLSTLQQSHALQLIYYFNILPSNLLKNLSKCCTQNIKKISIDIITQVIEIIRYHINRSEKKYKLKPSVHISFLCTILVAICCNNQPNDTSYLNKNSGSVLSVLQEVVVSLQFYGSGCLGKLTTFLTNTLQKELKLDVIRETLVSSLFIIITKCLEWQSSNNNTIVNEEEEKQNNSLQNLLNDILPKMVLKYLRYILGKEGKLTVESSIIIKDLLLAYRPLFNLLIKLFESQLDVLDLQFILDCLLNICKIVIPCYNDVTMVCSLEKEMNGLLNRKEFKDYSTIRNQIQTLLSMNK
ncbi:hypothetical protein ABK040_014003 [Willaertia magna]